MSYSAAAAVIPENVQAENFAWRECNSRLTISHVLSCNDNSYDLKHLLDDKVIVWFSVVLLAASLVRKVGG